MNISFGDNSCFNFRQLSSGHWIGTSMSGYYTSTKAYPKGDSPDRFKYEDCRLATVGEIDEYMDL